MLSYILSNVLKGTCNYLFQFIAIYKHSAAITVNINTSDMTKRERKESWNL